jgi:putative transcriptional regulator
MLKIHLSKLLGEKRINQSDFAKMTGIRPGTINAYYHEYAKRYNAKDIDKMCEVLGCKIQDLIEQIPDKK